MRARNTLVDCLSFAGLVAMARCLNPIPSRTRSLNASAPMVLRLKTRKSRSLPGLPKTDANVQTTSSPIPFKPAARDIAGRVLLLGFKTPNCLIGRIGSLNFAPYPELPAIDMSFQGGYQPPYDNSIAHRRPVLRVALIAAGLCHCSTAAWSAVEFRQDTSGLAASKEVKPCQKAARSHPVPRSAS